MSFDQNLPDPTDTSGDGSGGFDFGSWLGSLFGGGGGGAQNTGPFDPNRDQITGTQIVPGGRQVSYQRGGQTLVTFVPDTGAGPRDIGSAAAGAGYYVFDPATGSYVPDVDAYAAAQQAKQSSGGPKSLAESAAGAGFYNPDGTPDTQGYLAYRSAAISKSLGGGSGSGTHIPGLTETAARAGYFNPDGSIDTQGYLNSKSAIPPSLAPGRPAIVSYLQALLGQNALPYSNVGLPGGTPPVAAPVAAPATPVLGGGIGGGVGITPPALAPTRDFSGPIIGPDAIGRNANDGVDPYGQTNEGLLRLQQGLGRGGAAPSLYR